MSLFATAGNLPTSPAQQHELVLLSMRYDHVKLVGYVGSTLVVHVERHIDDVVIDTSDLLILADGSRELIRPFRADVAVAA